MATFSYDEDGRAAGINAASSFKTSRVCRITLEIGVLMAPLIVMLGDRAVVRSFTAAESAAAHSHIGALVLMNGVVLDWLAETLDVRTATVTAGVRSSAGAQYAEWPSATP